MVFVCLFAFIISLASSKIISINYLRLNTEFCINAWINNGSYFLAIDLKEEFNWVDKSYVNKKQKNIGFGITRFQGIKNLKFSIFKENLQLGFNFPIEGVYFYQYDAFLKNPNKLTFSYSVQKAKYNIVKILYESHMIDDMSFGLHKAFSNDGIISFGGIDPKVRENKFNKTCNVVRGYRTWGCKLDEVVIDGKKFVNKNYAYFQSSRKYILAPADFLKFLEQTYFSQHIKEKDCEYNTKSNRFECFCSSVYHLPEVNFIFEGINFSFKENLFEYLDEQKCKFLIFENTEEPFSWEFGFTFIEAYDMLFNYTDSSITFYSHKKFKAQKDYHQHTNLNLVLFFATLIILIYGILFNVICFYKFKY